MAIGQDPRSFECRDPSQEGEGSEGARDQNLIKRGCVLEPGIAKGEMNHLNGVDSVRGCGVEYGQFDQ